MTKLIDFLNRLEEAKISYHLLKCRDFSITVMITVPGERWEVDFLYEDGDVCSDIWVERFKSNGTLYGESELETLFREFSD